jgi:hypothetical protein
MARLVTNQQTDFFPQNGEGNGFDPETAAIGEPAVDVLR